MSTATFAYTPVFTPKEPFVVHRSSSYTPRHIDRTAEARYEKIPTSYDRRDASGTLQATPVKPTREFHKRKLALLLPGHNEELIIAHTIQSAIIAGQNIRDIYVVNDASTDRTKQIATELLGKDNVLTVKRSGKALAVQKAVKRFKIEKRYTWLHIADADSIFSPEYFREYRKKLDENKYAVAVGFVQSLRGNWISTYRALTYTFSQHINRRIQSKLGMISVFPGPITCFRTDIMPLLEMDGTSLTEDFDITLQVHRKKLGKIVFIPKAINYTQDPQNLSDFWKQNIRWQRGFFQGVRKYKIGLHAQRIDVSLGFQMMQTILFILQLGILLPFIIYTTRNWMIIPVAIAADFIVSSCIAIWASFAARRWNMMGAMPYFYFLRWMEILIYFIAFFEVMILGKFREEMKGWGTEGRRYKVSTDALQEIAAKA
jgi:cellulose synthase/poly-beta-1,6-N-acetylglucosamine synthase-like glycosyltransferase